MDLEQIIPALALLAVLILVLPGFIETNLKKKVFLSILVFMKPGRTNIKTAIKAKAEMIFSKTTC